MVWRGSDARTEPADVMISLAGRGLRALVRLCCRFPRLTVTLGLGLSIAGVLVAASRLTFETSGLHLLPPGQAYVERYREYSRDFGELDEIIIVVRSPTVEASKAFAARLVDELRAGPIAFNHLAYRATLDGLTTRGLLYLPAPALAELRDRLFDHEELIQSFAASPGLVSLVEGVHQELGNAFVSRFMDLGLQDGAATDLSFLLALVTQMRDAITHPSAAPPPWRALLPLPAAGDDAGYFLSDDKRLLFIVADPVGGSGGFTNDRAALVEIRRCVRGLQSRFPGVEAGVTGGPALSNDEMSTAFDDSMKATALAFVLTVGLLLAAFRRVAQPLVIPLVLALSLAWSLGCISLTVGHLTVFSVMFISIVIGLGIDYGIYVLFRYDEEIARGRSVAEALDITASRTGPGVLLGALTAAATFYSLMLTDFHGVQELGFIAGTSLLAAFLGMLTVFPAILVLMGRRWTRDGRTDHRRGSGAVRDGVARVDCFPRRHAVVLVAAGVITAVSLWSARTIGFDYNLLNLQASGTESVVWEEQIIGAQARSSFSALSTATSLSELTQKRDAFARLPSVAEIDSALLFIPDQQAAKLRIIRDAALIVGPLRMGVSPSLDVPRLTAALDALGRRLDVVIAAAGAAAADSTLPAVRAQVTGLLNGLRTADHRRLVPALTHAPSTMRAVALNGLTTIAGFGGLLVAHHRGIWSLGLLLTVGSVTSLVAALVVLPALVGLLDRGDRSGGRSRA